MIPEDVLVSWAKRGKDEMSKQTYNSIKNAITKRVDGVQIYLQGSYSNHTNVRDNSDIDILVICSGFTDNIYAPYESNLRYLKQILFQDIQYSDNFNFSLGNKTIKYRGGGHYVPADIVPCIFSDGGIKIYDSRLCRVIQNYPLYHKKNGFKKSDDTFGNYKKTVRIFKNSRNYLIKKGIINDFEVPSYFLECLLYNVPDPCYYGNEVEIFSAVLNWLYCNKSRFIGMYCQNEMSPLFGTGDTCWNLYYAQDFVNKLRNLDLYWGQY